MVSPTEFRARVRKDSAQFTFQGRDSTGNPVAADRQHRAEVHKSAMGDLRASPSFKLFPGTFQESVMRSKVQTKPDGQPEIIFVRTSSIAIALWLLNSVEVATHIKIERSPDFEARNRTHRMVGLAEVGGDQLHAVD